MHENTQVIILAAGEGNRLKPHTADKPKCMVRLLDTPIVDHQLRSIRSVGIENVCMVTGYRADKLAHLGLPTRHNDEFASSNMVHSLMCAKDILLNGRDTVIAYADIAYEPRVLSALLQQDADLATVVDLDWLRLWRARDENPLEDAETLRMVDGCVIELGKRPRSLDEIEGQYIGLTKLSYQCAPAFVNAFDALPETGIVFDGKDRKNMYMTSFLQHLIDSGWNLGAATVESGWIEVDTTEDLALYERLGSQGSLETFIELHH